MELADTTFRNIADLMYQVVGLSFSDHKKALIASRLAPRLQRLGMPSYEAYVSLLRKQEDGDELQHAIDLLTTNETYFFREQKHFDLLAAEFARGPRRSASVWSAASSYGDEAYSIAMVLADLQHQGRIHDDWQVLGTDISERVLQGAKDAVYALDRIREVSPERQKRYLLKGHGDADGLVAVKEEICEHVRFGQLNLTEPIDVPGPFDVIFLRNVLIYFDQPTKRAVCNEVLQHLVPGGLFFIGTAEGRVETSFKLKTLGPGAFRLEA